MPNEPIAQPAAKIPEAATEAPKGSPERIAELKAKLKETLSKKTAAPAAKVEAKPQTPEKPAEATKPQDKVSTKAEEQKPTDASEGDQKTDPKAQTAADRERRFNAAMSRDRKAQEERAVLAKERTELEAARKEHQAEMDNLRKEAAGYREAERLLRTDPVKFLEKVGLPYGELTKRVLNDGKVPIEDQLKDEFGRMKAELEQKMADERARFDKEAKDRSDNEKIQVLKNNIRSTLKAGAEKFELASQDRASADHAFDLMVEAYREKQISLTPEQALDLIEKDLEGQVERMLASKKLQGRYAKKETQEDTRAGAIATSEQDGPEKKQTRTSERSRERVEQSGDPARQERSKPMTAKELVLKHFRPELMQ